MSLGLIVVGWVVHSRLHWSTSMSFSGLTANVTAILVLDKASTINKFKNHADLAFFSLPIVTLNFWENCLLWYECKSTYKVYKVCLFGESQFTTKNHEIILMKYFLIWFHLIQYLFKRPYLVDVFGFG